MKEFILSYRKEIITHSIAFVLGFVIAYFIFTSVDDTKIENNVLELEKQKGAIQEKENNLIPETDLKDDLESAKKEIEYLNNKVTTLTLIIRKDAEKELNNIDNLYDNEHHDSITSKSNKIRGYKIQ